MLSAELNHTLKKISSLLPLVRLQKSSNSTANKRGKISQKDCWKDQSKAPANQEHQERIPG